MQLFSDTTVQLKEKVNELSVYNQTTPFYVEIRDNQLTLESSEAFYVVRLGARLLVNYEPRITASLTPRYGGYRDTTLCDEQTIYYDRRKQDDDDSSVLLISNWYGKNIAEKRERQLEFFRYRREFALDEAFEHKYRADHPEWSGHWRVGTMSDDEHVDYESFKLHRSLFMEQHKSETRDIIEGQTQKLDAWLEGEFLEMSKKLDQDIAALKARYREGSPHSVKWCFTGDLLVPQFFNMHGDSFKIDLYNRTLGARHIIANPGGPRQLVPYQHLHIVKDQVVSVRVCQHPLFFSTKVKRQLEEDVSERKKCKKAD